MAGNTRMLRPTCFVLFSSEALVRRLAEAKRRHLDSASWKIRHIQLHLLVYCSCLFSLFCCLPPHHLTAHQTFKPQAIMKDNKNRWAAWRPVADKTWKHLWVPLLTTFSCCLLKLGIQSSLQFKSIAFFKNSCIRVVSDQCWSLQELMLFLGLDTFWPSHQDTRVLMKPWEDGPISHARPVVPIPLPLGPTF